MHVLPRLPADDGNTYALLVLGCPIRKAFGLPLDRNLRLLPSTRINPSAWLRRYKYRPRTKFEFRSTGASTPAPASRSNKQCGNSVLFQIFQALEIFPRSSSLYPRGSGEVISGNCSYHVRASRSLRWNKCVTMLMLCGTLLLGVQGGISRQMNSVNSSTVTLGGHPKPANEGRLKTGQRS